MPDNKNLQFKNMADSGRDIIEQAKEIKEKIEEAVPIHEKEAKTEISPADKEKVLDEISQTEKEAKIGSAFTVSAVQQKYQQREKQIENILANGLADLYVKMLPDKQKEFKIVGEQTAHKINSLLSQAKIKIKEIISLIRKWLSIIPGVNKFFLEQEAKIKADEIMRLKK